MGSWVGGWVSLDGMGGWVGGWMDALTDRSA